MIKILWSTISNIEKCKILNFVCAAAFLIISEPVFSHGTVTYPASRVWNCFQEGPESPSSATCIAAVASHGTQPLYDWNEINQPDANGQHTLYVMDGNLASGGRPDKYGGLDQVSSDWVTTALTPGPDIVTWTNSAPHASLYYQVYITKSSWTPDQPLTWASLDLLVETLPSPPELTVDIPVIWPSRTGKHVVYSVWQRSDSPEAFYSASDVDFGDGSGGCTVQSQNIMFPTINDQLTTNPDFTISASASSGLPVSLSIVSGPATVSGNMISLTGTTGTVVVRASQAGDSCYSAAADVDQSFLVTEPTDICDGLSPWVAQVYNGGAEVTHLGLKYRAKWWAGPADEPGNGDPWEEIGSCPTEPEGCQDYIVKDEVYIPADTYHANISVSSAGQVDAGTAVNFRAEDHILMNAGFEVKLTAEFSAEIEACPLGGAVAPE